MSVDALELSETTEEFELGGGRGKTRTLSLGEEGFVTGRKSNESSPSSSSKESSDWAEHSREMCDALRPPSC